MIRLLLIAALATVSARAEVNDDHEEAAATGAAFEEGKGLRLSDETRESIGLDVADVEDRPIRPEHAVVLQVFQIEGKTARASGFVDPAVLRALKTGQPVRGLNEAGVTNLTGRIAALDDQAGVATGRGEIVAEFSPCPENLRVGGFIDAVVADLHERTATTIPARALLRAASGNFVYVENGPHFLRTPVAPGARSGEWVEITEGLYAGDRVVAEPAEMLWLIELRAVKGGGHTH